MAGFPTESPPFTGFGTNPPDTSMFNSIMESLKTAGPAQTSASSFDEPSSAVFQTSNTQSTGSASNVQSQSTFATMTTGPQSSEASSTTSPDSTSSVSGSGSNSGLASNSETGAGSTATAAGSTESGGVGPDSSLADCHSVSCSPGLKAAIAVPVVVGVLAIFALAFFLLRRRNRNRRAASPVLGQEMARKKWTRHLRIFSFDTELLMGGRYSSTNSVRTRSSLRDNRSVGHVSQRSLRSADEVAPPYRDAISHVHHPNMSETRAGAGAGGLVTSSAVRPDSRVSEPPPYGATENRPYSSGSGSTDTTPIEGRTNPFADSNPVSPVEWSPFNDPPEDASSTHSQQAISRSSSIVTGPDRDGLSNFAASEAGSIREVQVGRHVSVASRGRTIANVRTGSQSPASST